MKKLKRFTVMLLFITFASSGAFAFSIPPGDDEQADTINYNVYQGIIINADDNTPLPFATVGVLGLNIATVSNIDGEFILKIPKSENATTIKVTYIGYKNFTASIDQLKPDNLFKVKLQPTSVNLKEVTIRSEDALGLMKEVLNNIKNNYSTEDMMMKAFYRETTKKRRNYVSISEAVVDIYKAQYNNEYKMDQMKLIQGRKSADVEKMDTILFKIQGGPFTTLMLDIVKNPYVLLSEDYHKVYSFSLSGVITMNDRLHYVVSFHQYPRVTTPFYKGKLYIDMDKLAITEAEFELNMENEFEVANMFIKKKPIGMKVQPEKAAYRVKYTIEDDNKWYFSYARAEVKFDVAWDRKLFKTSYTAMSEIAITDRSEVNVEKIPSRERFKQSQILDDLVYVFFDKDFWGAYNVIEPDQSIESAIRKLNRKFLRNTE